MEIKFPDNAWTTFLVALPFFIGLGYLLLRVAFGKRRRPTAKGIIITSYVIGSISCILLVLSVLGLGNIPYLISIGLTGLTGSSALIKQGKRRGSSKKSINQALQRWIACAAL